MIADHDMVRLPAPYRRRPQGHPDGVIWFLPEDVASLRNEARKQKLRLGIFDRRFSLASLGAFRIILETAPIDLSGPNTRMEGIRVFGHATGPAAAPQNTCRQI